MAYSVVSAGNPKALLAAVLTFASTNGWATEYDDTAGAGGVGGQIALSSGNCHVAIGEQTAGQNPIAVSGGLGPQNDGRLYMAIASSINVSNKRFWGHPDSLVDNATSVYRSRINDVWGPMDEVHLFGNSEYVIVTVRCAPLRWTTFGFGNLDTLGMTCPKSGFCFSNYFEFWNTEAPQYNCYSLNGVNNRLLLDGVTGAMQYWVPDNILDPTLGFSPGAFFAPNTSTGSRHKILPWARLAQYVESLSTGHSLPLDQVTLVRNQPTTGGVMLHSLPVIYRDDTTNLRTFLGQIPGIRAVRMTQNAPGDTLLYGVDEYLVFPWKQKGVVANTPFLGGAPNNQPNTYDLGWAILKD